MSLISCSTKCLLVVLNLLFLLVAVIIIVIGSIIQASFQVYANVFRDHVSVPAVLFISLGILILSSALFGLLSTLKESYLLLSAYFCILVVVVMIETLIGIIGFTLKSYVRQMVIHAMVVAEKNYNTSRSAAYTWDTIQNNLLCCGLKSYKEWSHFLDNSSVPDSCCVSYSIDCGMSAIDTNNVYTIGCGYAVFHWLYQHQIAIGVVCITFVLLKVMALMLARYYSKYLNEYGTV